MRPRSRLALAGCAALLAFALALPGCGKDAPAPEKAAARRGDRQPPTQRQAAAGGAPGDAAPHRCQTQLGRFVDSLDALRRRLAVGLTYAQYVARVTSLRAIYATIPVHRLGPACLLATGAPSERAFNVYLEAANTWGACLSEAGCGAGDIEATLQAEWRTALRPLSEARAGLRRESG
jgi:hypothetical protein